MILRRAFLIGLLTANFALMYLLFLGDQGVSAYRETKARHDDLVARIGEMNHRGIELSQDIRLLKTDREHMERAVRAQTNYVRGNEILYLFSTQRRDNP
ncbi:Septum formation initiator [Alkalidesulfovibrio alkalitolerans DSM 16529]|jgi:cell division protein FtsB|uniref:Septum formation initiator n=1 Tax=Alkalidesulfovibrio alkalitolerans DSM 16529 TaxID=1121439 RepID=S7T0X5_9BACT|nr:septum formation initiator family protein [Alkalidesulfovibrio alkalitolerans]EPR30722.1 Septum formation initiator [Alkalidesulfovibrio alkalitolerans DSM 16529]